MRGGGGGGMMNGEGTMWREEEGLQCASVRKRRGEGKKTKR